jgi:signal transduction histidine kinase
MATIPSFSPLRSQPLRLLIHLEWILLGFMGLTLVLFSLVRFSWLSALSLVLFVILGWRLPTQRQSHKVLYTLLEFGLLLLPILVDPRVRFPMLDLMPMLGLVIVIRSCRMFALRGRILVACGAFAVFILFISRVPASPHTGPRPQPHPQSPEFARPQPNPTSPVPRSPIPLPPSDRQPPAAPLLPQLPQPLSNDWMFLTLRVNAIVSYGLALLFILLLINALLAERHSREQLRQYALRIENQAALQERNRIAREIHDSLGHALTAQSIQLENALMFLSDDDAKSRSFLTEARQLGTQALREVRQSVATLRSDPLQGKSLEGAIAALAQDFHTTSGISLSYQIDVDEPLSTELSTAVYRIVQESLTNSYKHSHATDVTIKIYQNQVTQASLRQTCIKIEIIDNGDGFDPSQNTTGFGLQSMQERTMALGGQFYLTSQPQHGCHILVILPLLQGAS